MITATSVISVLAIVFGALWLYINVYTFSPVYRKVFFRLLGRAKSTNTYTEATTLPDSELPTIDVLMPAYDEADMIEHSIRALREARYPAELLRICVLVEADDRTTRNALSRLRGRYAFDEFVIPPSYPGDRNKPRALNYGFGRTDGDIVGVIDAEDIVDPALFRQVVRAITEAGHDYAQGKLDMRNEDDGPLNTLFRGEYGFWYGTVIPGYFRVGYPVPLGGTTNFVARDVLDAAAAARTERFGSPWTPSQLAMLAELDRSAAAPWDPRNVTEDFELGLLLWELGYDMALVTAVTREESPVGVNAWIRQRTRWQKGKLFTLYQRLRYPPAGIGKKAHIYSQSAAPHLGPVNIVAIVLIGLYSWTFGFLASPVVATVLLVSLALALQQLVIHALGYWVSTDTRGLKRAFRTLVTVLGVPIYWTLHWGSDMRAFLQLAAGFHGWEKTAHSGRHLAGDERPPTDEQPLRADIVETPDGWLWRVTTRDETLATAAEPLETASAAEAALETFLGLLPVATGTEFVFEVAPETAGWQWRLERRPGTATLATGVVPASEPSTTFETIGRVRSIAGRASPPSIVDPSEHPPEAEPSVTDARDDA